MALFCTSSTQRSCCVPQLFSLLHEIFTDSHRACFKLPDSNFQRLKVVLKVDFQRDGFFLFISCLWRFGVCQLPAAKADVPINIHLYFVQESCSWLTWLNRSFFAGLVHTNIAGTEKYLDASLHRSGHHRHRCFVEVGVFFRQIFTIQTLRCPSSLGTGEKTVPHVQYWRFCILLWVLSHQLHKDVVWPTAHLHSERLPICTIFSRLYLLARNKRHLRTSCHEEKANSKRNLLVEQ